MSLLTRLQGWFALGGADGVEDDDEGAQARAVVVQVGRDVLDAVFEQVSRHERRRPDCETGGGLLGTMASDGNGRWRISIKATLPPGPLAQYRVAYFEADRAFQRRLLHRCRQEDATLSFLGDWHRHPARLPWPSAGDYWTDQGNLDESFRRESDGVFLFPIVTPQRDLYGHGPRPAALSTDGAWRIDFFYLRRGGGNRYRRLRPEIVAAEPVPWQWRDESADIRALLAYYPDIRTERQVDGRWSVWHVALPAWGSVRASLRIPPTYPFQAPHVLLSQGENQREYESPLLDRWGDCCNLLNLVYEINYQIGR